MNTNGSMYHEAAAHGIEPLSKKNTQQEITFSFESIQSADCVIPSPSDNRGIAPCACPGCCRPIDIAENENEVFYLTDSRKQRWHTKCFKCGILASGGCGRSLVNGDELYFGDAPYCEDCHRKMDTYTNAQSSSNHTVTIPDYVDCGLSSSLKLNYSHTPTSIVSTIAEGNAVANGHGITEYAGQLKSYSSRFSHFVSSTSSTLTLSSYRDCSVCEEPIGEADCMRIDGRLWHRSCFRCGVNSKTGCHRLLTTKQGFSCVDSVVFCNTCFVSQSLRMQKFSPFMDTLQGELRVLRTDNTRKKYMPANSF